MGRGEGFVHRSPHRLFCAALAGAAFVLSTPAEARPDEPALPPPPPSPSGVTIDIKDKPPVEAPAASPPPSAPSVRPAPPVRPTPTPAPAPAKEPPPVRARTSTYALGILGFGSAFIVAGGILVGIAAENDERCGVAGCYGVLDPQLEYTGKLLLGGGIGMSLLGGTAALVGLGTDGRRTPRRSDAFTEMGIFATALGAGLVGTSFASLSHSDALLEGMPGAIGGRAVLGALVTLGVGMGFWIYGARAAPSTTTTSLRVGPTSAEFAVRY